MNMGDSQLYSICLFVMRVEWLISALAIGVIKKMLWGKMNEEDRLNLETSEMALWIQFYGGVEFPPEIKERIVYAGIVQIILFAVFVSMVLKNAFR